MQNAAPEPSPIAKLLTRLAFDAEQRNWPALSAGLLHKDVRVLTHLVILQGAGELETVQSILQAWRKANAQAAATPENVFVQQILDERWSTMLFDAGYRTALALSQASAGTLTQIPNFGQAGVAAARQALATLGLQLHVDDLSGAAPAEGKLNLRAQVLQAYDGGPLSRAQLVSRLGVDGKTVDKYVRELLAAAEIVLVRPGVYARA